MTETTATPYRVVQWATGNIGTRSLRAVIEHPNLHLVGVYVHSADKIGVDAGTLCGLDRETGITATGDIDDILALEADCVLYMPRATDAEEVCALLAAGLNIVTTRGEFHHPASMDKDSRARVESACTLGNASIHSTGSSPGFITEAVPIALTSIQRRLERITIEEFADLSQRDSPGILFDVMGFGAPPTAFDQHRLDHLRANFEPSLRLLADAVGLPLDTVDVTGEVATARQRTRIAAGTLAPGSVAAQRITISGYRESKALIEFRATWYCTTDVEPEWEVRPTGWHIFVDGDAPLDVDLRFPVSLDMMSSVSPGYTANRAVNAVPHVCAAPPGIRTSIDLPQFTATLG
ncbi:dihydrodipicolinate reductase [Nocardia sp. NPDC005366]|uniref:NAD(P)H-dependent amine dehydrogenase family protein n=1 Tax=Nocardia sp. NPDC005366 TaxID=3156878 RepID=UPI0033B3B4A8